MAGEGLDFANQNPNNRGNQRIGRPKKEISTLEELLECKGMLLKDAAVKLGVCERIVRREMKRLTDCETWTEFQRRHGTERMQDKDKVFVIIVTDGEIQTPVDLAKIEEQSRYQELQKFIEQNLKFQAGSYVIKWFVEGTDGLTISSNESLKACFSLASERQLINPVVLKVEIDYGVLYDLLTREGSLL